MGPIGVNFSTFWLKFTLVGPLRHVILSAAKDLWLPSAQILRCAQDDNSALTPMGWVLADAVWGTVWPWELVWYNKLRLNWTHSTNWRCRGCNSQGVLVSLSSPLR